MNPLTDQKKMNPLEDQLNKSLRGKTLVDRLEAIEQAKIDNKARMRPLEAGNSVLRKKNDALREQIRAMDPDNFDKLEKARQESKLKADGKDCQEIEKLQLNLTKSNQPPRLSNENELKHHVEAIPSSIEADNERCVYFSHYFYNRQTPIKTLINCQRS